MKYSRAICALSLALTIPLIFGCSGHSNNKSEATKTKAKAERNQRPKNGADSTEITQDPFEKFKEVFAEYPWDVPASDEAKALSSLGLRLNFNEDQLAKSMVWIEFDSGTAAEQKEKVIQFLLKQLASLSSALSANEVDAFGIKEIAIGNYDRLFIQNGTFFVPKRELSSDRLATFVTQYSHFVEQANKRTDGLLVLPATLGTTDLTPKLEYFVLELSQFHDLYDKSLRPVILKHRQQISQVEIQIRHNSMGPFIFENTSGLLKIPLASDYDDKMAPSLDGYLSQLAHLSAEIREQIVIEAVEYFASVENIDQVYSGFTAGLQAIKLEEDTVSNCTINIRAVHLTYCSESVIGTVPTSDCGTIVGGHTMYLPVGTRDIGFGHKPAAVNEVREQIRSLCCQHQ